MLEGEIAGRLAEATNRNLYVLSIITTLFLPMTLVTGIFGMNVAGLPGTQDPGAFRWVVLGMTASAAGLLAVLRWRWLY